MSTAQPPETLAEALPKEQARVRALIPAYEQIGPPGAFALACMRRALETADIATAQGDLTRMIRAYNDLKGYTA